MLDLLLNYDRNVEKNLSEKKTCILYLDFRYLFLVSLAVLTITFNIVFNRTSEMPLIRMSVVYARNTENGF